MAIMPSNPKAVAERFETVIQAWETLRPTKTFAGLTLAAFKAQIQPSFDARQRLLELEAEATAVKVTRDVADRTSNDMALLVVNAVKGDPLEGENGELYAAMGYIRKAERRSGLTRRTQSNPPSPATNAQN